MKPPMGHENVRNQPDNPPQHVRAISNYLSSESLGWYVLSIYYVILI
jgi:hypothetical protein